MAIHYDQPLDRTFHALGDGIRRGMLATLAHRGECTAGELGEPFRITQPSASKHLHVLEQAGLIRRRVEGRTHHFRLETRAFREARGWIDRHQRLWEGSLDRLEAYVRDIEERKSADEQPEKGRPNFTESEG
jgi:DNA-binding transcriptional ArsR family regulator